MNVIIGKFVTYSKLHYLTKVNYLLYILSNFFYCKKHSNSIVSISLVNFHSLFNLVVSCKCTLTINVHYFLVCFINKAVWECSYCELTLGFHPTPMVMTISCCTSLHNTLHIGLQLQVIFSY